MHYTCTPIIVQRMCQRATGSVKGMFMVTKCHDCQF